MPAGQPACLPAASETLKSLRVEADISGLGDKGEGGWNGLCTVFPRHPVPLRNISHCYHSHHPPSDRVHFRGRITLRVNSVTPNT